MAYSDYGGYGFLNGVRVEDRSDVTFGKGGTLLSTPGAWPGWVHEEGRNGGSYHVVLGDADVLVCLYKQSTVTLLHNGKYMELARAMVMVDRADWIHEDGDVNVDALISAERVAVFKIHEYLLEVLWEITDNHYVYAKLTQPDGKVWTGFSGYQVGAGFEGQTHPCLTQRCVDRLEEIFPLTN
jgi:hypothetical protein